MAQTLERDRLTDADARLTAWLWGRANRDGSFSFRKGEPRALTVGYVAKAMGWGETKSKAALKRAVERGDIHKVGTVLMNNCGHANVYALDGELLAAAKGSLATKAGVATATAGSGPGVATATAAPPDLGSPQRPHIQGPIETSGKDKDTSVVFEEEGVSEGEAGGVDVTGDGRPGVLVALDPTASGGYHRARFADGREMTVFNHDVVAALRDHVGQRIDPVGVRRSDDGVWLAMDGFSTPAMRREAELYDLANRVSYWADADALAQLMSVARHGDPRLPAVAPADLRAFVIRVLTEATRVPTADAVGDALRELTVAPSAEGATTP